VDRFSILLEKKLAFVARKKINILGTKLKKKTMQGFFLGLLFKNLHFNIFMSKDFYIFYFWFLQFGNLMFRSQISFCLYFRP
jgi:hypothetical protein